MDVVSFVLSAVVPVVDLSLPNGEGVEVPAAGVAPNEKRGVLVLLLVSLVDLSFDVLSAAASDAGGAPKLKVFFKVVAAAGESNEKGFFSAFSLLLGAEPDVEVVLAAAGGAAPNVKTPLLLSFLSAAAGVAPNVKVGTTVGSLEPSLLDFFTGVGPNWKGDDVSLLAGVLNENGDEVEAAAALG